LEMLNRGRQWCAVTFYLHVFTACTPEAHVLLKYDRVRVLAGA
jgi:hypothetical protein